MCNFFSSLLLASSAWLKHQAPTDKCSRGLIVYCCRRLFFRVVPAFAVPAVFAVTFKIYIVLRFSIKITRKITQCEGKFSLNADNFRVGGGSK
ncbi:hypothetical protein EVA_03412 [gut metagenome]|uniref:Uncharacterized protein n=1 Tax=gut metagenome TaxID=749906 RepID=J9GKW5_9ZZZZ